MKEQFISFLTEKGYSRYTPAGNPSTVYDYPKRINKVCELENLTWGELGHQISSVIVKYDIGGEREDIGNQSKRAVINALKRYKEFIKSLN